MFAFLQILHKQLLLKTVAWNHIDNDGMYFVPKFGVNKVNLGIKCNISMILESSRKHVFFCFFLKILVNSALESDGVLFIAYMIQMREKRVVLSIDLG